MSHSSTPITTFAFGDPASRSSCLFGTACKRRRHSKLFKGCQLNWSETEKASFCRTPQQQLAPIALKSWNVLKHCNHLEGMNRDMDDPYHQSGAKCSSRYKKMHPAAVAPLEKQFLPASEVYCSPTLFHAMWLMQVHWTNLMQVAALYICLKNLCCVKMDKDLPWKWHQISSSFVSIFWNYITQHGIVPRILKNRTKESGVQQAVIHFHSWTGQSQDVRQSSKKGWPPHQKQRMLIMDPKWAWLSLIESKKINDPFMATNYSTWRNTLCELCPQQVTQVLADLEWYLAFKATLQFWRLSKGWWQRMLNSQHLEQASDSLRSPSPDLLLPRSRLI